MQRSIKKKNHNMESFNITDEQIHRANEAAKKLGCLNKSFTKGKGNFHGLLGEIVFSDNWAGPILPSGAEFKDYDFSISTRHDSVKVDVKTKEMPQRQIINEAYSPTTYAFIAETSTHQQTDVYVWVIIPFGVERVKEGHVIAWMRKKEFFERAKFAPAGMQLTGMPNPVPVNCYYLPFSEFSEANKDFGQLSNLNL
jgi:hypothetical protein